MSGILVIENPNDQWSLGEMARGVDASIAVQEFAKSAYALAWLKENQPGLVLVSYRLPDLSCEEFVQRCRQIPGRGDIPIIVAAAEEDGENLQSVLQAGNVEVIVHPDDSSAFLDRVRALLEPGPPALETQPTAPTETEPAMDSAAVEDTGKAEFIAYQQSLILSALDSVDQGIVVTDKNLTIVAHNKRQSELIGDEEGLFKVGANAEYVIKRAAAAGRYGPGDPEELAKSTLQSLQSGRPFRMERTDGSGRTIEIVIRPLAGGGRVSVYTDITDQTRTAEALQSSNQRLSTFVDSAFDWYWETDRDHHFTDVQKTFFDRYSITPSQVLGKTRWEFAGGDPEQDDKWRAHFESLNAGRSFRDFRYSTTDAEGRVQYWRASGKPAFDNFGHFSGYQGAATCETDLVEARLASEREIAARADILQATFEGMSQGLVALDENMMVVAANAQAVSVLKQPPEAFQPGSDFTSDLSALIERGDLGSHDRQRDFDMFFKMARSRDSNLFERELPSGETVSIRIEPLPNGGNVVTFTDVTYRAVANERLRHGQKLEALGQMAGGIAHEFNNLLTSLSGFAHMALKKPDDSDRVITCLEEISEVSGRAIEITRQMLTFSHKQVLAPTVVLAGETVRGMEKLLSAFIEASVELRFEMIDEDACIEVDPARLSQCIVNLVNNARHAMPDGGSVTVRCETVDFTSNHVTKHGDELTYGPYVHISVADTGTGIDPDSLSRIFDPFFTTKEAGVGTGLGLSLVYGMINNSKGAIDVESEIGVGTTFSIYLPVADGEPEEPEEPAAPEEGNDPVGSQMVLVAEDDSHLRRFVQIALEDNGFAVITAPDGEAAFELYKEHAANISMLVTDVVMPKMSGVKLAKAIGEKNPSLKVLYISGYAPELSEHFDEIGEGAAFMRKPFDPDDLSRKVRELLSERLVSQSGEPSRAA